jgi:hypothetical protein
MINYPMMNHAKQGKCSMVSFTINYLSLGLDDFLFRYQTRHIWLFIVVFYLYFLITILNYGRIKVNVSYKDDEMSYLYKW